MKLFMLMFYVDYPDGSNYNWMGYRTSKGERDVFSEAFEWIYEKYPANLGYSNHNVAIKEIPLETVAEVYLSNY